MHTLMPSLSSDYWSTLINFILQNYFSHITTCILLHSKFDLILSNDYVYENAFVFINPLNLNESFENDIYDFKEQDSNIYQRNVAYDNWIKKYMAAIESSHCEGFVAFGDHIPLFVNAFVKASSYSFWRSMTNRFLFIHNHELDNVHDDAYFKNSFFQNTIDLLIIEMQSFASYKFSLKTTKFVGSLYNQPEQILELSAYNALNQTFSPNVNLYPDEKQANLQGREIIFAPTDYRPFVAVDYVTEPLLKDIGTYNSRHRIHVDGTEVHILHEFCAIYNCTVLVYSIENSDWGEPFYNMTGIGLIGLIMEGKAHMAMGAFYPWLNIFHTIDISLFLGRSGVTCMVPAPQRLSSWTLPLQPFQLTLWLSVLACLLVETTSLFLARYLEYTIYDIFKTATNLELFYSALQFGYAITLKILISQSSSCKVNSHTVRTVLFACYMIDIIITSVYGGGLSSILTMPRLEDVADSVERLSSHNLLWTGTSYGWTYLMKDVKNYSLYEHLVQNFRIHSLEDIQGMAKTENMGFVVERLQYGFFGNADFITPQSLQRLKLMTDDIYYSYTVAAVPRLWPHLKKLNELIIMWHSAGLSKYWDWKMTSKYLNITEQNLMEASRIYSFDKGPVKLSLQNFAGLVLVWLLGIGLSLLVFLGECFWHKFTKKR